MGAYIGIYDLKTATRLGGDRIGTNGSNHFLVEQWIAGWAANEFVDPKAARKARSWLRYTGKQHRELMYGYLTTTHRLTTALMDDTDDCSWVAGDESSLSRVNMNRINDRELHALVSLWHTTNTFYQYCPYFLVTDHLAKAVLHATERLEELVAPWAGKCRTYCSLIQRAHEKGGYVTIG